MVNHDDLLGKKWEREFIWQSPFTVCLFFLTNATEKPKNQVLF